MSHDTWICAVIIRRTQAGLEFWLRADQASARWGFPQFLPDSRDPESLSRYLANHCHVRAGLLTAKPVATLPTSRVQGPGQIEVFAFRYLGEYPQATRPRDFRVRWCLLEEAQLRIRRKPLQRIIQEVQREYTATLSVYES